MRFPSKRNEVCLEGGRIVKRYRKRETCLREAQALQLLYRSGLLVPALLGQDEYGLTLEYIPGETYADLTEDMTWAQAEALSRWLAKYHEITGCLRGDVNLRNFLWTNGRCVGVDFEDPSTPGPREVDLGRVLAFAATYRPSFSANKARSAKLLLNAFLRTKAEYKRIRDAYLDEISAINQRRAADPASLTEAGLFFAALTSKEV
jgi:tRNA A-37 threonylcarbamoyl transferase component Bud32